ncbi:hypothetical protein [Janibacter sp. G1551]|uniref:hypothetical protein n=1 Tax=Janibacter sp. G1551 TaxID=3420440 RepID=UPI003D03037C
MALVTTVKKTVADAKPLYVAAGVTDLAVERVREAGASAARTRDEYVARANKVRAFDVTTLPTLATARVTKAVEQAQAAPTEAAKKAQDSYADLTARGEKLVKRVRTQKATQDLVAQVEATLALGKGLVTTTRKSVDELERSVKATVTTGRKEATVAADAIVDSVTDEAKTATAAVKGSARRTRTAAKRTTTTARTTAAKTATATKKTATAAKTTAAKSTAAAKKTAEKVGD